MKKIIALLFPSLTSSFAPFGAGKLTVDGALAQFNKVIADLKKVKAAQDAEEVKNQKAQEDALAKRDAIVAKAEEECQNEVVRGAAAATAAAAEAIRAARAIAKIEAFVA